MADSTHAADAGHGAAHGAEHASGAFPPFDFALFSHQVFWFLIAFGLLYFMMSRVVLPQTAAVIGKRESALKSDRDAAARAASAAEKRRDEADKAAAQARSEARALVEDVRAKATAELGEEQAKADATIAQRIADAEKRVGDLRVKAMGEVQGIADGLARDIVAKLAPRAVS